VAAVLAVVAIAAALALAVAAVTRNEGLAALRAAQVVRVPDPDIEPAGYKQPEGVARPSRSLGPPSTHSIFPLPSRYEAVERLERFEHLVDQSRKAHSRFYHPALG
jgi:hypothetical protein